MGSSAVENKNVASPEDTPEASLLLALEEISHLVSQTQAPAATLSQVVRLIQNRFGTDVCSVYLLTPDRQNLVLTATVGLRPECVGTLRMGLNEGLAGLVATSAERMRVEARPEPLYVRLIA